MYRMDHEKTGEGSDRQSLPLSCNNVLQIALQNVLFHDMLFINRGYNVRVF